MHSLDSDPIVTDWLLLRTALWRVGERSIALEAVGEFRKAAGETPRNPLTASIKRVDALLERFDAFCSSIVTGRARARPGLGGDFDERAVVFNWLAENHWTTMRLVAWGVWKQSGGHLSHADRLEEDMLQEFLVARDGLATVLAGYDPLRGSLMGYILICFRRACTAYLERESRRNPWSATNLQDKEAEDHENNIRDGTPSPEELLTQSEILALLWREVDGMDQRSASALHLQYEEGLTHAEIAAVLGISSEEAAKQLAWRAKNTLKRILYRKGVLRKMAI
jgi:RNA polymerase sigma factor (sigma-70 family)